jgi:hypothetical protein
VRAYRCLFALAAACHVAFGAWLILWPQSVFSLLALEPPRYPSLAAALGLAEALFGLVYAHVARYPERGGTLVAIGLLGKVLVPIGWLAAVARGEFPTQTFLFILGNDLLWWFPFLFYLLRQLPGRRAVVALVGVVVHILASLGLLVCAGGTEIVADMGERARWVSAHVPLWAATWIAWALASMSLIAFAVVWCATLLERGAPRGWAFFGWSLFAVGLCFDLTGESLNLIWPTQPSRSVEDFAWGARLYGLLSAGTANGLYCAGGILLSGLSWRLGWLRGWVGVLGFGMWLVGVALTVMVVANNGPGMIVTGGGVMVLFIPWVAVVGWRLLREGGEARPKS